MLGNGELVRAMVLALVTALLTHLGFAVKPPTVKQCEPDVQKKEMKPDNGQEQDEEQPKPKKKKKPQPPKGEELFDPTSAIGRIQFGNAGCTATVIAPRRVDGRWDVLTAAHCIRAKGQLGTMSLRGGERFAIRVVTFDEQADCCWCVTDSPSLNIPSAKLLGRTPAEDDEVWHCGFGIDKPGNVERGRVAARPNSDGQVEFLLSVSSGDSGGGIVHKRTGAIISPVCCTSRLSGTGRVWGACPEVCTALRPSSRSPTPFI